MTPMFPMAFSFYCLSSHMCQEDIQVALWMDTQTLEHENACTSLSPPLYTQP